MKAIRRQAVTTATLVAVTIATLPAMATAQRQAREIPKLIVSTFRGTPDAKLGIEVAKVVRDRVTREVSARDLALIPQENINQYLQSSGYNPDSALSLTDLRDLGRQARAAESIDGTVTRMPDGQLKVEARYMLGSNLLAIEALPVIMAKDANEAGRAVAKAYAESREQLDDYRNCENAIREKKYDAAVAAAQAGIAKYQPAVLSRLCLLQAYNDNKQIDQVIATGEEVIKLDPRSMVGHSMLAYAYKQKGENDKAVQSNLALWRLDPTNSKVASDIVFDLANSGAPDKALPIIDTLLSVNPGDPAMIDTKWKLLLAVGRFKDALATGEELVKYDTSKATADFFTRMAGAAVNDSQPDLVIQYLARGAAKYPGDARLQIQYADQLRRAGQLQQALDAAKRAMAADAKVEGGLLTVLVLYGQLDQADSAIALAQREVAAGGDKKVIGDALLGLLGPVTKAAQTSGTRADWEKALAMSLRVDSISSTPATKFFAGVAAAQAAIPILQSINDLAKSDKARACSEAQVISRYLTIAEIMLLTGGAQHDPQVGGQIMQQVVQPYKAIPGQVRSALKC